VCVCVLRVCIASIQFTYKKINISRVRCMYQYYLLQSTYCDITCIHHMLDDLSFIFGCTIITTIISFLESSKKSNDHWRLDSSLLPVPRSDLKSDNYKLSIIPLDNAIFNTLIPYGIILNSLDLLYLSHFYWHSLHRIVVVLSIGMADFLPVLSN